MANKNKNKQKCLPLAYRLRNNMVDKPEIGYYCIKYENTVLR